ncbi:AlpA family transcriptional regulator [Komagataeibacter xylinus]|uniref:Uncharacterized protein n=1 Tax=Komagataeibacter xylinus TaxID=28448 RepID=A0A857FPC5_KOMXY|nr:hypothetical protein [Komagataeibacter xylinus]QHC36032.1 hypothetical protein FMA36_11490 [Komagataeibacter xylinus]
MDDSLPRWLDRQGLADYLSVKYHSIARLQQEGKIPQPTYHLGPRMPRWDRHQVDETMGIGAAAERRQEMDELIAKICADIRSGADRKKQKKSGR